MNSNQQIEIRLRKLIDNFNCQLVGVDHQVQWNEANLKLVKSFVQLIDRRYSLGSIGDEWLFTYLCFQYEYWLDLETQIKSKTLPVSWILGEKAFNRYLNFPYRDFTKARGVMSGFGIRQSTIWGNSKRKSQLPQGVLNGILPYEELIKQTFFDQEKGFVLCIERTTLFNPFSDTCNGCRFRSDCKAILQRQTPSLFVLRGLQPVLNRGRRRL